SVTNSAATNRIYSVDVGVRLDHPRESDLALTLVSPHGTRVLLAENRGAYDNGGYGGSAYITNVYPTTTAGNATANTNILSVGQNFGKLLVTYEFFTVPDQMVVYYDGNVIFDSGMTNGTRSFSLDFGPGTATDVVIVMNPGNNTNVTTAWNYQPTVVTGFENYFIFTENTNSATLPMKFYPPPFRGALPMNVFSTNFDTCQFGNYPGPNSTVADWTVTSGFVRVLTNSAFSPLASLGLAQGTITRTVPTTNHHHYSLGFAYRTFNLNPARWWPGETNGATSVEEKIVGEDALLQGGTTITTNGRVGSAMVFDGVTNFVSATGTFPFHTTNDSTFAFWVNTTVPGSFEQSVFWTRTDSTDINRFNFYVRSNATFGFDYRSPVGVLHPLVSNFTIPLGEWVHLAISRTGNTYSLFTNGVFATSATDAAPSLPNTVGWRFSGRSGYMFAGMLDEVVTYNLALQQQDVRSIYYAGTNGLSLCGTALPPGVCGSNSSALVSALGLTNRTLVSANTNWLNYSLKFTANSASTTLAIQGLQAGMLIDSVTFLDLGSEGYAFPEESLDKLKGETAYGNWKLEVWDNRTGATNPTPILQAWKLDFVLDNTVALTSSNTGALFNPVLPVQTNLSVDEMVLFSLTNTATPVLGFTNLTYTLVNPPAGATIDTNGVISWTPSETQGPATFILTTVVTDDQFPQGSATNSFHVTVNEVNRPPVLPTLLTTNYFLTPGTFTLVDTATDPDFPVNNLTYTLALGPTNALVDQNGVVTWTPGTNDAPSTNLFTVIVTDSGTPALSATNFFYLVVGVGSNAPSFSLMQYNVKGNGAPDWSTNAAQVQAIGRQILYLQPDVITFNEIPVAYTNQMANWALAFGYYIAVSPGNDGTIGVAVASKYPFTRTQSWLDGVSLAPFGGVGNFTRDLFEAEINIPGFAHPVHVFTTHLKSSATGYTAAAAKRAAEAAAITNFFTTNLLAIFPNDYYTLSGDMNEADTNTLAIQRLVTGTGLQMTTPVNPYSGSPNTFSIQSPPPSSRIDFILPCGALASNILSSQVFRTDLVTPTPTNFNAGDNATASDHLPVLMTFRDPTFVVSNLAPVFVNPPQSTNLAPLTSFIVTNLATDSDLPPQTITYSLLNPPTGMMIDSNTAIISWTPATNQLGTFTIGTIATDGGSPVRSTTNYFQLFVVDLANIATNIVAFPGAEGAGAFAVGGRGGSVYHVTSLINDGPGSLRFGLRTPNRTIVFDISGTIELTSDLKINRSFITIAGQTAPGEGITLSRRLTSVQDNRDVQIRFIRCRPGDYYGTNFQNDSFHFDKVTNSIADHVSASWSIDETLSCTESRDITVQWSMITDSLNNSFHDKGAHGYGSLLRYGDGKITYHHNLYADHESRSPRLGDNLTLDFVNNVIYNWGGLPGYSGTDANDLVDSPQGFTNRLNYVGNYAVAGSNSSQRVSAFVGFTTNTWVYSASNRIDSALDGLLNGTNSAFGLISGA
ncbi:MAG: hypothetical protein RL380_1425, partial [Verrucomicrobiota bacterium]